MSRVVDTSRRAARSGVAVGTDALVRGIEQVARISLRQLVSLRKEEEEEEEVQVVLVRLVEWCHRERVAFEPANAARLAAAARSIGRRRGQELRRARLRCGRCLPLAVAAEQWLADRRAGPEQQAAATELAGIVRELIEQLPSPQRDVAHGRLLDQRPYRQIAAELGLSYGCCRELLRRAKLALRRQLRRLIDPERG